MASYGTCPSCGQGVHVLARRCRHCQSELRGNVVVEVGPAATSPRRWPMVAVSAACVAAVVIIVAWRAHDRSLHSRERNPIAETGLADNAKRLSQPWESNMGSTPGTDPELEILVTDIGHPWCAQLQQCGLQAIDGTPVCAHVSAIIRRSALAKSATSGTCALDRAAVTACGNALVSLPCQSLQHISDWGDLELESCADHVVCPDQ